MTTHHNREGSLYWWQAKIKDPYGPFQLQHSQFSSPPSQQSTCRLHLKCILEVCKVPWRNQFQFIQYYWIQVTKITTVQLTELEASLTKSKSTERPSSSWPTVYDRYQLPSLRFCDFSESYRENIYLESCRSKLKCASYTTANRLLN